MRRRGARAEGRCLVLFRNRDNVKIRFENKIKRTNNGCWVWTGATAGRGYGKLFVDGKDIRAHRVSWLLHRGELPDASFVLHRCDNPPCVNPDHLFLGDQYDNMRDCASKRRIRTIGKSRLTHCKQGHEFTVENTNVRPNGHRRCAECTRNRSRRQTEKLRQRRVDALAALDEEGGGE